MGYACRMARSGHDAEWAELSGGERRLVTRTWEGDRNKAGSRADRRSYRYDAYVPVALADREFTLRGETAAAISAAEQAVQELNLHPPGAIDLEALARHLLRADAVASSRIEGLVVSHRRLARAFFVGGSERPHDAAGAVVANVLATERAIQLATTAERITIETIQEIHHVLFDGTKDEGLAGIIRAQQNWIGGIASGPRDAAFIPPPQEFVIPSLEDLVVFMERRDLPTVLQAAIVHAQFETIHPFLDGNGRVGRALIHVVLRRRGLAPSYVPPVSLVLAGWADRYVQGLTDYRFSDPESWQLVFAESVETAAQGARAFAGRVSNLTSEWMEMAGNPRPQSAARKLIDQLPSHPVVNLKTAQRITGMTSEAARTALNRLERAGVLSQVSVGRRNRAYETVGLFELLDSLERDLGPRGRTPPETTQPRAR